jgi:hypothetical protein
MTTISVVTASPMTPQKKRAFGVKVTPVLVVRGADIGPGKTSAVSG